MKQNNKERAMEELEAELIRQARPFYREAPDLRPKILQRLKREPVANRHFQPTRIWLLAALVLGGPLFWLWWRAPESVSDRAAQAPQLPAAKFSDFTERLASASGLRAVQDLAQGTQDLLATELELPIRSELAAIASDARRTAESLFAGFTRPFQQR